MRSVLWLIRQKSAGKEMDTIKGSPGRSGRSTQEGDKKKPIKRGFPGEEKDLNGPYQPEKGGA